MPDAIYLREAGRLEKVSYDADVYMPKDARHAIFNSPPLLSRGLIFKDFLLRKLVHAKFTEKY